MAKYKVEMKKFKDGTWYTKTQTDNYASACSVAQCHSTGHEYNIIDNETGSVLAHGDEDQSMKEYMLDKKNAYLWKK